MENQEEEKFKDVTQELKIRSVRGSLILLTAQVIKFALQITTTILLSRLILPEDFGIFAIIFAVIGFLAIFKDGGLGLSSVQSQTLNQTQLSTLFWFNSLIGFGLTVITIMAAWLASQLYSDARLFQGGSVIAATFLFIGLASQPRALLNRQMDFTKLAVIEVLAMFFAAMAGIITGFYGGGFWALVIFYLILEFVGMSLVLLKSNWRPAWRFNWKESRSLVTFGSYLTGFELIGYLYFTFDKLLVGWFWGSTILGFYDKAYQLLLVPFNQLNVPLRQVIHSALSRLQNEPIRFQQYFYRYLLLLASIGMPLVGLVFGTIETTIPLFLGENWLPTVVLFKALAPAAFCMTISPSINWLFISLGRAKRQLYWNSAIISIWLVVLIMVVPYSVLAVTIAFSIMRVVTLIPTIIYACYESPIDWRKVLKTVALPAVATFGALGILSLSQVFLPKINKDIVQLLRDSVIYGLAYIGIWILMPNGINILGENFSLIKASFKFDNK
jgi:O-antigen/teichoic acid export membrane protein